jgi:hypothetical protein
MLGRIISGFGITEDVEETETINLIEVEQKANNFFEWLMCEDQDVPQFKFTHVIKKSSSSSKKTLKIANTI